jgi:hypothetical protein
MKEIKKEIERVSEGREIEGGEAMRKQRTGKSKKYDFSRRFKRKEK